jgi:NAD(P)H-dependent flavin oxidoreductase YrpB (nitropropane dioxygenase family)
VSNAGGLGVLGGAGFGPDRLREEINRVRGMTTKPFGVDLLLPSNYMGGAASGEMPRDPRELIPASARAGVRKMAEDLGIEWQEMPPERTEAARPAARQGGGMSDAQMEVVIERRCSSSPPALQPRPVGRLAPRQRHGDPRS